jgi:hypothetical protein
MANSKISALTASTTPLAGTEVLPIVQSGATVKVAVSDLTAGRNVSMQNLTATGTCLLGTSTAPAYGGVVRTGGGLELHNSQQININASNALANFEWVQRAGLGINFNVTNATVVASLSAAGVWINASDARYKENIRPVSYGLAEVMQLQPRAYNMINSKQEQIGFVAQEVQSVLPELVEAKTNSITDEDRLTLSYGQMSAVLVKAIQELKAEFDAYKASHP